MRFPIALACSIMVLTSPVGAEVITGVPGNWTRTWGDEFNTSSVNTTLWSRRWPEFVNGANTTPVWGDIRMMAGLTDANVTVGGGVATITARKQNYGSKSYTSGVLNSTTKFAQKYGYFEARIKSPPTSSKGLDADFFLFPNTRYPVPEIDIVELPSGWGMDTALTNLHWGGGYGTAQHRTYPSYFTLPAGQTFHDDFHTFGLRWEADLIEWYIDGVRQASYPGSISNEPMAIFLALEVNSDSGDFYGNPADPSATWPASMQIDYIRVYAPAVPEPVVLASTLFVGLGVLHRPRRHG